MSRPLLDVTGLTVTAGPRNVVEDVGFTVDRGRILGLVGESGSGKTVTCRALMRLLPSRALQIAAGRIVLDGTDLAGLDEPTMRTIRGRKLGMIFQNPASHLDPVMSIGGQIGESIRLHRGVGKKEARGAAIDLLRQVGIPDPAARVDQYPHEFSGGMKQRAMIATALACDPDLLIADEPTTALDVTVQAQILRLLLELRDRRGLAIVLITHDLGVVAQSCDSIAVMYAGRVVERGPKRDVLKRPTHPYTAGLIRCQPGSGGTGRLVTIGGQPPSMGAWPDGCRFNPRCARAQDRCRRDLPLLQATASDQLAACHFPLERAA